MGDTKPRRSNKTDLKLLTQSWGPPSECVYTLINDSLHLLIRIALP